MPQIRKAIHPKQAALWRSLNAQAKIAEQRFQALTAGILASFDVDCPGDTNVVLDDSLPELVYSWADPPDQSPSPPAGD